ncbi:DUF4810 domain-containing protein [Polaromonas sp. P1(28)-8]|nr:DUF4810 domain-containing protein [Polaromonas sp. P1(28)-8]
MYQWGGYDQALYSGYKDPTKMESMRVKLEAHIAAMEQSKQKVAPGLYAELGTLYLQAGSPDKAVGLYAQERDAWPEGRSLMTAMIQNIERRQKAKEGAQK